MRRYPLEAGAGRGMTPFEMMVHLSRYSTVGTYIPYYLEKLTSAFRAVRITEPWECTFRLYITQLSYNTVSKNDSVCKFVSI